MTHLGLAVHAEVAGFGHGVTDLLHVVEVLRQWQRQAAGGSECDGATPRVCQGQGLVVYTHVQRGLHLLWED